MKRLRRITAVILAMVMVLSTMTNVFAAKKFDTDDYWMTSIGVKTSDNEAMQEITGLYYKDNQGKGSKWIKIYLSYNNFAEDGQVIVWHKTKKTTQYKVEGKLENGEKFEVIIENVDNYRGTNMSFYDYCENTYNKSSLDGMSFNIVYTIDVKCNVTYNVDGVKETDEAVKGENYTIKSEKPEKAGYTFAGWLYNGNTYEAGQDITKIDSDNIELKAQWDAIEYSVSYDANEGNGAPTDSTSYIIGNNVVVSDVVPTKDKAVFKGWSYNGKVYAAGDEVEVGTADVVFTAVWNPIYKISYVVDNEEVAYKEVEAGTDVSELLTYEYTKLDDSKNLSVWTLMTDANVKAIDKDIVVSATTSTKTFTVVYNLNGKEYKKIENVPYGTKTLKLLGSPADESEEFSGWEVTSGDFYDVKSDVVISGSTSVKKFTVTYKVDGFVKENFENVKYGTDLPKYNYIPDEGYDFSGWDNLPEKVTDNLVIEGTTSIKSFTVKFVDDNGDVVSTEKYTYGSQAVKPADPKKADVKVENGTDAAKWSKFTFAKWVADGEYTMENLNSVKQDMTFKATYKENKVKVLFFVLNRGLAQKEEPGNHSSSDYSKKGVEGSLKTFEAVNNNDEKVAQIIHTAPSADKLGIELEDGEYIKWYVTKPINNGEKWHVDGIIVGQKYDLVVNYVDDETNEPIMESTVTSVAATSEYNVELPEIKGYELVENTTVSGVMPYDNVETTVKYQKKTYTVTYKVGEDFSKKFTVKYGEPTPVCTYIAPEGYDFLGWGPSTATVQSDLVIEGKIQKKKFTVTYKVAGDDRVKDFSEVFTAEYGDETPTSTYKVPEGYDFLGWGFSTATVKSNLIIEGKIQKKTFTVTYKVNGEVVDEFTRKYGDPTPASTYVVPEGYDFSGWGFSTATVKSNLVFEAKSTIKTFTVTYKVDGETVAEIPVEYGDDVPAYEYEVAEGYEFSGFELVTEVEDATVVKQNMVFEGTTNEIVVEEEEDIELDTPFAPGTGANDNNDVDDEEEEDITLDTPFASGTKGTANNNDVDADEEEDIDLATPFSSGVKTGDASNYTAYVAVLLIAAVGAMVVAYNKKKALN